MTLSSEQVTELYEEYEGDPDFFSELTAELTAGPVIAMALEKADGVAEWLKLLGPEDVGIAVCEAPLTVRGIFGSSNIKNAAHGSRSPSDAFRELKLFFPRIFPRETTLCVIMPNAASSEEAILSAVASDGFLIVAKASVRLSKEQACEAPSHTGLSTQLDVYRLTRSVLRTSARASGHRVFI